MKRLLENTPESMYWLGFIFADGWFDFNRTSIGIMLSEKDRDHMIKLCEFLDASVYEEHANSEYGHFEMVKVLKRDKTVFTEIVEKYGLVPKKTYNPPTRLISTLEKMSDDLFVSFMVGFFDGDGSMVAISKHNSLTMRFQNHVVWKFLLDYFENRVYNIFKYKKSKPLVKVITTRHGNKTACLSFARYALVSDINLKVTELDLPVMFRKWSKVRQFLDVRQQKMSAGQITAKRNKRWLDSEIELLTRHMKLPVKELQQVYFPSRSSSSIFGKISMLKSII